MRAFIDSHNSFLRKLSDSGQVRTTTTKRHSKIPWSGLWQLPQPDEFLQLFEYTCSAPYRGSISAQGNFLCYFRSLPLQVRQPILILSPFVGDPRECG